MRRLDLVGQRFGRWTVIDYAGNEKWGGAQWLCKCICGNEKIVGRAGLTSGSSQSCGCLQKELLSERAKKFTGSNNPNYRGDLTGQKFGYWTVLKYVGSNDHNKSLWKCRCRCGVERVVIGDSLVSNKSKSCGCYGAEKRINDLIGQKFGRLYVIEKIGGNSGNKRNILWKCLCDCGNEMITIGSSLTSGHTRSCGCYRSDMISQRSRSDLADRKFGRLIALKGVGTNKNGSVIWLCKCDCGNEVVVVGRYLVGGNTKSCGCLWKERIRETHSGENNFNWKGGITPENQLVRQLPEYNEWRTKVFERDGYICQMCGKHSVGDIQAHHIYLFSDYIDLRFEVWNGITLCKKCHTNIRRKESKFVERFLSITTGYKIAGR